MNRIALLTSGGDAPGMNAAIRAVVRTAIARNVEAVGVQRGYAGLIERDFCTMTLSSVGGILQRGGTVLRTARSDLFMTAGGQRQALQSLAAAHIDGLLVIGGNGSFRGALDLHQQGFPVVGIPASIDNDIAGTDYCIGVDTALNTIVNAVDMIKETASSHERTFVIEVMGRDCGYLALMGGLAAGAEAVLLPEQPFDIERLADRLQAGRQRGKQHAIVIVAEGAASAYTVGRRLSQVSGLEVRITVLGHLQRGGSPTAMDRLIASDMGVVATEALLEGQTCVMAAQVGGRVMVKDMSEIRNRNCVLDPRLFAVSDILAQ